MKSQLTIRDLFWMVLTPLAWLGALLSGGVLGAVPGAIIGGVGATIICSAFPITGKGPGDIEYARIVMVAQAAVWGSMVGFVAGGLFVMGRAMSTGKRIEKEAESSVKKS